MFYFEVDFRKHVIDRNSCDWLKFIVFIWCVCKQCRIGKYTFRLHFFLIFVTICNYRRSSNSIVVTFFGRVCFQSRKSELISEVKNQRQFLTPCVFSLTAEIASPGKQSTHCSVTLNGDEPVYD